GRASGPGKGLPAAAEKAPAGFQWAHLGSNQGPPACEAQRASAPTMGYKFAFTLPHEPPVLSGRRPAADGNVGPAEDAAESPSASGIVEHSGRGASGIEWAPKRAGESEGDGSCPAADDARNPQHLDGSATA